REYREIRRLHAVELARDVAGRPALAAVLASDEHRRHPVRRSRGHRIRQLSLLSGGAATGVRRRRNEFGRLAMKWLRRIGIGLAAVVVLGGLVVWWLLPPVNVPLKGMLANAFPKLLDVPSADAATVKSKLTVPAGYGITLFARDVPDAR